MGYCFLEVEENRDRHLSEDKVLLYRYGMIYLYNSLFLNNAEIFYEKILRKMTIDRMWDSLYNQE